MKLLVILASAVIASLLAGCNEPSTHGQAHPIPDVETIASDYHNTRLVTPEPVFVDPHLAMLCIGVSESMLEAASERNGPHAHSAVRIYMNDLAYQAFDKSPSSYAVGSVIVKEKQLLSYRAENKSGEWVKRGNGVGGMVKRKLGYDPENGDWEYFYFESIDDIESGRIENCIQCHKRTRHTDYIFGSWKETGRQP